MSTQEHEAAAETLAKKLWPPRPVGWEQAIQLIAAALADAVRVAVEKEKARGDQMLKSWLADLLRARAGDAAATAKVNGFVNGDPNRYGAPCARGCEQVGEHIHIPASVTDPEGGATPGPEPRTCQWCGSDERTAKTDRCPIGPLQLHTWSQPPPSEER